MSDHRVSGVRAPLVRTAIRMNQVAATVLDSKVAVLDYQIPAV
jgi:hypothetical protein